MTKVRDTLSLEIAQALVRARQGVGLSQRQMAERIRAMLGTRWPSAGTLTNWEAGIGTPPAVVVFAAFTVAELMPPLGAVASSDNLVALK